jgi:adhesin/invasin
VIASRLLPFSLIVSSAVFAACGGEGLTLPPEGEPANIEVVTPEADLVRQVTEELPLVVKVTDTRGDPVAGAAVTFSFVQGEAAGSADPETATTGPDGQASTTLTLGTATGTYDGIAQVTAAVTAEFQVTALPAGANRIRIFSGEPQSGTVNTDLDEPLVVVVTDATNNPIAGVPIQWTAEGGGTVSPESNFTDANGQASAVRTLGPTAGPQTTIADAGQLEGSPITFTHTATAGNPAGITKVDGDNQNGPPGAELAPLIVEVRDELGNVIPNRDVTWVVGTGGGTVNPPNTRTNAEGQASTIWTLGPGTGQNTVNAVVSGVGSVTFTATADAGAPSSANSDVSVAPSTIPVGGQSTITVVVRDGSNNPVSGTSVSVAASGSGNTITPASASTNGNGVATFTFSSTVDEMKTITATAGGVTLNDQPTIRVQKTAVTVEIMDDEPDPSTVGEPISVEFRVRGSGGMPTGEVVVTISGGDETCRGTLTDGNGSCMLTPTAPGPDGNNNRRVITATYGGDAVFAGGTDTDNHRVNPPVPVGPSASRSSADAPAEVPAGSNATITVTVRNAAGTPLPGIPVSVSATGTNNTITPPTQNTDVNGVATFTFSSTTAENKTITVTAGGVTLDDQPFIRVTPLPSTTTITSDNLDPSTAGAPFTVTFTVTGSGSAPTGTVSISSDQEQGVGCTVEASAGSCSFALNTPGQHVLRARYFGDAQYLPSDDPDGELHTVN